MGISASVTNNQITATVGETQIDVAVSGGVGPTGSSGTIAVSAPITNAGTSTAAVIGISAGTGLAVSGGSLVVSYGTSAGTACQGNDARLSDARTPLAHTHTASQITDFTSAVIAAAPPTTNASLLTSGTLPDARLSSNIARTSDVSSAVAAVVNAAPATLDTLKELADALGSDANFSTTVTNALAAKAPIANPTFTGTVSGVTKSMVGLGNVPNVDATARANHTGTQAWSTITDTPTTLAGYGITNAATSVQFEELAGNLQTYTESLSMVAFTGSASDLEAGTVPFARLPVGATSTTVAAGNDARFTDARTPTAHKSSHATGGTDALSPSDIGASALGHTHSAAQVTDFTTAAAAAAPVQSVAGRTGAVTLAAADVSGLAASATTDTTNASNIGSGTLAAARLGTHATTHNPGGSDPVTLVEVYEFTRTTKPAAATGSNGSYTFTIPAAAKMVEFFAIGAGGGGGSGRRGAAGSARFGGGGGGPGGVMLITRTVAELASRTVSILTGAGGAGGAARTTDDTNGNNGSNGIDTAITIGGRDYYAARGNGGSGGTNAAGAGGTAGNSQYVGSAGASSSATAVPPGGQYVSSMAATGGAAGGGISTGDVSYNGGISRANGWLVGGALVNSNGGTAPGGNGQNASDAFTQVFGAQPGGGGGGGAAGNATTAGGNGGNGANYGGAGGGGGASFNGYNSGAGGNGGDGYVRITVWY